MPLTDSTDFQAIAESIGAADNNLQGTLDTGNANSALSKIKDARADIGAEAILEDDAAFDAANTLETAMRTLEVNLISRVQPGMNEAINAIATYFLSDTGLSFRAYFTGLTSTKTFTYNTNFGYFRTAWRRVKSEELIVPIGSIVKGSGVWPGSLTSGQSFTLPTLFEIRTGAGGAIGAAAITVNITCTKSDDTTDLITLQIPALAAAKTQYPIGGTTKYKAVSAIALSGGTDGDTIEVWLR